jgi:hypothetical protein
MAETKKVLMGDRCYQGAQWPERLAPGQQYDLPVEFADWLVDGEFAMPVKARRSRKKGAEDVESDAGE